MPGSDFPNVPRRDSGSGSYWSHERVRAAHLGHAQRRGVHRRADDARAATRSGMLVRTTDDDVALACTTGARVMVLPCWGQPVDDRRPFLLDEVERGAGVERALGDEGGAEVQRREERGDQAADPEERHRREHHVVGAHRVAQTARCTSGARPCPACGSRPSGRRCCPSCRRSPRDRQAPRTPRRARGTRRRCRRCSPAATISASSPRDQARSDGPHTWMARRNGASGRNSGCVGRLRGEPGQRGFEAFEVVVVQELRVRDEVGEVGVARSSSRARASGRRC